MTNYLYLANSLIDGIEDNNLSDVKILLKKKSANPNILLPERGIAPFHFIAGNDSEEFAIQVTKLFLSYGGDPNVRSDEGMTPVHIAAAWGKLKLLCVLIDNGGKSYLIDHDCKTPLDYAKEEQHNDIVNYLHNIQDHSFIISCPLKLNKINSNLSDSETEDSLSDEHSRSSLSFYINNALVPVSYNKTKQYVEEWCKIHSNYKIFLNKTFVKNEDHYSDGSNFLNESLFSNLYGSSGIINDKIRCSRSFTPLQDIIITLQNDSTNYKRENTQSNNLTHISKHSYGSSRETDNEKHTSLKISGINTINSYFLREKNKSINNNSNWDKSKIEAIDTVSLYNNSNSSNSNEYLSCNNTTSSINIPSNSKYSTSDYFNKCMFSFSLDSLSSLITSDQTENLSDNKYINQSNKKVLTSSNQYFHTNCKKTNHKNESMLLQTSETESNSTCDFLSRKKRYHKYNFNSHNDDHIKCPTNTKPTGKHVLTQNRSINSTSSKLQNLKKSLNKNNAMLQLNKSFYLMTSDETESEAKSKSVKDIKINNSEVIPQMKLSNRININKNHDNTCTQLDKIKSETKSSTLEKNVPDLNPNKKNCMLPHNDSNSKIMPSEINNKNNMIINEDLKIPTNTTNISTEPNKPRISISEEYKHTDDENGIVLIEKRRLITPFKSQFKTDKLNSSSESIILPTDVEYDTDTLRGELTFLGHPPGPITKTTKRVYVKKLIRLHYSQIEEISPPVPSLATKRVYSIELEKTLKNPDWYKDLRQYASLEQEVAKQFSNPNAARKWREGVSKSSFTYLLLDPRITKNLPVRSEEMLIPDVWKEFLSAIFYIGKGKRSRPYAHLYQAISMWNKHDTITDKKVKYIFDIWKEQCGVICLHVFQNVIPVEAYTREAAMIDVIGLKNLQNNKHGDYYGIACTWPCKKKRLLGVYLLYRAMQVFLNEGERQLRPQDIN